MIKLKRLIEEDETQKYVKSSPKLRRMLEELIESEDYKNAPLGESIVLEDYTMLGEWVSLAKDDLYDYHPTGNAWYSFTDKNGIKHEIRIYKGAQEKYEVKLWFNDKSDKPQYSRPEIHYGVKYDTRIYNTYFYILINELLPQFFKSLPQEKLYLTATDKARYRLYRITLNNHLDKDLYTLEDLGNNTLTISFKQKA